MIEAKKIEEAFRDGVCFVCSLCERFYVGDDRGLRKINPKTLGTTSRCSTEKDCCGPVGGGWFDDYKGELDRWAIASRCYMCGDPSDHVLKPKKTNALPVGICKRHLEDVNKLCIMNRNHGGGEVTLMIAEYKIGDDKWEKQ